MASHPLPTLSQRERAIHTGPAGLNCLLGDCYPDLTVGAIASPRFAPHSFSMVGIIR